MVPGSAAVRLQPKLAGGEEERVRVSIAESPLFLLPTRLVVSSRLTPDTETLDARCEWLADQATAAAHNSAGLPVCVCCASGGGAATCACWPAVLQASARCALPLALGLGHVCVGMPGMHDASHA
jgi:hypothetical protein